MKTMNKVANSEGVEIIYFLQVQDKSFLSLFLNKNLQTSLNQLICKYLADQKANNNRVLLLQVVGINFPIKPRISFYACFPKKSF